MVKKIKTKLQVLVTLLAAGNHGQTGRFRRCRRRVFFAVRRGVKILAERPETHRRQMPHVRRDSPLRRRLDDLR